MKDNHDIAEGDPAGDEDAGCEFCAGMEDCLVEAAQRYKANGWDPDGEGSWYRFGFTTSCEACGRSFDLDAGDEAYEQTEGPESPTGSPADEVRRLAEQLGIDNDGIEQLIEVFGRRPMIG